MKDKTLIAVFMDAEIHGDGRVAIFNGTERYFVEGDSRKCLRYHNSWSWIMPVAKKFGYLFDNVLDGRFDLEACDQFNFDSEYEHFQEALTNMEIETLYEFIVEFINWYRKHICIIEGIKK